jgi:hypothetical protein
VEEEVVAGVSEVEFNTSALLNDNDTVPDAGVLPILDSVKK